MSSLRTLLLWAIMLAVPFQGYAAATMAFCTSGHADPVASTASAPATDRMSDAEMAHHDHGRLAPRDHSAHAASDDSGSAHKCGTCGACHAVALIAAIPILEAHSPAPTDIAGPVVAIASVAPRVPDKPPRTT